MRPPAERVLALRWCSKARHPLVDEPYSLGGFTPENFDRKFRGKVTLEQALVKSMNVPTVKLCAEVGIDKVVRLARALGVERRLPHELAVSLGMCEVRPAAAAPSTPGIGLCRFRSHLPRLGLSARSGPAG